MKTVRLYTNPCESGYVLEFEGVYYPFGSELSEEGEFERIAREIVLQEGGDYTHYLSMRFYRAHHERCVALCIEPLAALHLPGPSGRH